MLFRYAFTTVRLISELCLFLHRQPIQRGRWIAGRVDVGPHRNKFRPPYCFAIVPCRNDRLVSRHFEAFSMRQDMIHVRVDVPVNTGGFRRPEDMIALESPGVVVSQAETDGGLASIERESEATLASPGTVAGIIAAEHEGVDAVAIDCMEDPGLRQGRGTVSVPVLGPGQTGMFVAAMLGHNFSVVTELSRPRPRLEKTAALAGRPPGLPRCARSTSPRRHWTSTSSEPSRCWPRKPSKPQSKTGPRRSSSEARGCSVAQPLCGKDRWPTASVRPSLIRLRTPWRSQPP